MNAKKIATSVPGRQYEALERLRKRLRLGRSEAVQEALTALFASKPQYRLEAAIEMLRSGEVTLARAAFMCERMKRRTAAEYGTCV